MSNGAACCALEICCSSAAEVREKVTKSIIRFTHAAAESCTSLLDRMDTAGVIFAPASFGPVMNELAPAWAPLSLGDDDRYVQTWMEHNDLVFAPISMRPVIQDIAQIARKHKDAG